MTTGAGGLPDPNNIVTISATNAGPVNLVSGPNGDIFYPGFTDGRLHRIEYFAGNQPPSAVIQAAPTSGVTPLVVNFDAGQSTDPEGAALTYAWDLDADGDFDDGSSATAQWIYSGAGTVNARLRVTDPDGLFDVAGVPISINNTAPVAVIDNPTSAFTWKVGDPITFTGHAVDPDEPGACTAGLRSHLAADHAPLPIELPHASDPGLRRCGRRIVRRARSPSTRRTSS